MPFEFEPLQCLPCVLVIEPRRYQDERGWFMETYKASSFAANGIEGEFVQDNHSFSQRAGTLRGLHYQLRPYEQGKLVRCVSGEFLDIVVDIRHGSPTFGEWAAVEVSRANGRMVWVPQGFAHGLLSMKDETDVLYRVTAEYAPDYERTIRWDDPEIGLDLPVESPIIKDRDAQAPTLAEAENNFVWEGEQ